MTRYHAVMIDETGCEFGAEVEAPSKDVAWDMLRESYPESRIDQLESPEESAARQQRLYTELEREMYGEWFPDEDDEEDDLPLDDEWEPEIEPMWHD